MSRTVFDLALDRISEAQKEIDAIGVEVLKIKWYQFWKMLDTQNRFREAQSKLCKAKREYHRLWH
jgi:hypothetical protein